MTKKKFLRRDTSRHSQFGKRRKKLLSWRKPKGRDNKMREKRQGYPRVVKIGFKKNRKENIKTTYNLKDIEGIQRNQKIILGKVGKKKKIEMIKKAQELRLTLENANIKSFLKKAEKIKDKKGQMENESKK